MLVCNYFSQPLKRILSDATIFPGKDRHSMILSCEKDAERALLSERISIVEGELRERENMEYHFHITAGDKRERMTQYISDEELEKISMPIEITEE